MRIPPKKVPKLKFCAAIFDMDGVVADNMAYHTKAWEMFLQKYAPGLKIGDVSSKYGMTNTDLMSFVLSRRLSRAEVERYGEEKEQFYRKIYAADMAPLPGLVDFLREIKASGMRAVVATSAPKSWKKEVFDRVWAISFHDRQVTLTRVPQRLLPGDSAN